MSRSLHALMVDVDGVVIKPRPGGWAATIEQDLGLRADLLQTEFFTPHWPDVVLGRAGLHDRLATFLADHAPHLTSQAVAAYWFEQDAWLDENLLAQLAPLREAGVRLHLATVQEHERAAYLWKRLRLREHFEAMHYAADLGCAKPDLEFYRAIEQRTGFVPTQLALLDDRGDNVEAAELAGWRGLLWTGDQSLADVIAAAGLTAGA